jgi:hypothetical protein
MQDLNGDLSDLAVGRCSCTTAVHGENLLPPPLSPFSATLSPKCCRAGAPPATPLRPPSTRTTCWDSASARTAGVVAARPRGQPTAFGPHNASLRLTLWPSQEDQLHCVARPHARGFIPLARNQFKSFFYFHIQFHSGLNLENSHLFEYICPKFMKLVLLVS